VSFPIVSPELILADRLADALAQTVKRPLIVGICGAQGSGKSTLAEALARHFPRTTTLSLDDLYLTRAERAGLARTRHPLFATRGVPGTHDVALGLAKLDALEAGIPTLLPRFDKACDDRAPSDTWPNARTPSDLVIFEGWCVGAVPEAEGALAAPVNDLERIEDADGRWRQAVNSALAGSYQTLFARLDMLILLAAPGWETVCRWREEQEAGLRQTAGQGAGIMDEATVERFLQHYERLTRHILQEMPGRADLVLRLSPDRNCHAIEQAAASPQNGLPARDLSSTQ
jgi:D-glycerate 3-kinase